MIVAGKLVSPGAGRTAFLRGHITSTSVTSGRAPVLRSLTQTRLLSRSRLERPPTNAFQSYSPILPVFSQASPFQINLIRVLLPAKRAFQTSNLRRQQQQEKSETGKTTSESASQESAESGGQKNEEAGEKETKKEKEAPPPPPPHGDKTPWQVFTETLRSEFKASKEWNESTKALASSANQFTESESVRRARAAYQAASDAASSTTSSALKQTGRALGKGAAWTWDTSVVKGLRKGVTATGKGIEKVTKPVRDTKAYKEMKEVIDDGSSSRYGGWVEKEERRKQRELRELRDVKEGKLHKVEPMEEDPNAGTNITVHKDAAWKESWREFRDSSRIMQQYFNLKNTYNESENPLISTARSISDRVAGFFAENETAMVIKKFRQMDPNFQIEPFLREMREYILPEVLDAYVKGDAETLKLWLSDAQFHVYAALAKQYTTAGLKSDGRILDIRHVDISHARMLEPGDIPVFIVTCRTQEVHVYRNAKTNELAAGMEDKVQLVTYAIGVTRIPEDVNNPETRGWRMIELQKSGRDYI
ncbi:protein translocase subunit [Coccidioides posadasii str. Silveira]|uniref:Mitochondrial import inner membrane translocase subunit TIM44 n=2 Tax=Coccidioides posadasii TaxID=199306 RepID=E9D3G6_COCPS|nr:Tim44-like domain containing protein [Coccidioides posadasii C735 delta SOWgp]EER30042.1 Tim44-like domain containing protein [Coccidioides posadasii C735 delta SOWgp]EFW19161.1 mitochondrial import inner membrane translocase subunit TIM44 [Coccidioides posadasii str. Silveira]QVM12709.1 protein translocase subunit [Coccidioides posadasii str. Silveira]|eukprot:XP_003072187.1 Tim44-like domain containing protein [Coccidioides posadasii C735 delta SOWgp]